MRISKEPTLIRQIIMDHYEFPRNRGLTNNKEYIKKNLNSEACIDNIDLEVEIEGEVIKNLRFDGIACTISTASTSILTEMMKGKTLSEANKIIDNYVSMLHGKEFDEELLEEAVAFINTSKQANRIKCATLAWDGLKKIIDEVGENNE